MLLPLVIYPIVFPQHPVSLGPLSFNIFIKTVFSLLFFTSPYRVLIFVEDAKIFYTISKIVLSSENVLINLLTECNFAGLSFNVDKCKFMQFHRTRGIIEYAYRPNGLLLYHVNQVNDFGFVYVPSIDFHPYIDYIVYKALSDFIRRRFEKIITENRLITLHNALLCFIIEYGQ